MASLSWYQAVLLYACLARIEALHAADDRRFDEANPAVDRYLDRIWIDIMDLVRAEKGHEVVLGLYEGQPTGEKPQLPLAELLAANMEAKKSIQCARAALVIMLNADPTTAPDEETLADLRKILPVGPGNAVSRAAMAGILAPHGFLFGVLAHALETTREGGILPPAFFRWLRFVDHDLWRFLYAIGLPVPTPEGVGKFEHYQAERRQDERLDEPFLDDAPGALEREARKYVIDLKALRATGAAAAVNAAAAE